LKKARRSLNMRNVLRILCLLLITTRLVMGQSNEDRREEIEKREQAKS
jgi:hypothetical protein